MFIDFNASEFDEIIHQDSSYWVQGGIMILGQ